MSKPYARIREMAELEKAIRDVHARREKLGRKIDHNVHGLREGLKPSNLMLSAAGNRIPFLSWSAISLGVIRGLKRLLKKK